jgi:CheY-like chemotaxis protein
VHTQPETNDRLTLSEIPEALDDDRNHIHVPGKTILIVEDDIPFARALLDFTRKRGYMGIICVRGDQALQLAITYKPVAILLDIQLPVQNGWKVMDALKSNLATRHIPVHIMSSFEARRESMMKGAANFINKPIAAEQLKDIFATLETVLNKQHKKVLIVEENTRHAQALAYFLETFDVRAEISNTLSNSLDALHNDAVDCVILDMGIPAEHGYETLESIKQNPGMEDLPVIIFTGRNLSKTEAQKIKRYADSIVLKTAHSYQRILDEVSLFLHLMEGQSGQAGRLAAYPDMLREVLHNKTILITDDDVRNIYSISKALEKHQMNILTATDGKEALRVLEEHPETDIVLMDIMMPEMDGYETMRQIRLSPALRSIPVIAVTAKAMTGDREKCVQAGASDYISKPVDMDQLTSLLRVWLYDKA